MINADIELLNKPKIIIADDDPSVRFLLKHILEKENYHTLDASTGLDVLDLLEKHSVSMILLDAVMPELNGFEACSRIKSKYSELPVIIITSLDDDSSVAAAFDSGADDYITKPINWSVLKHRISRALGNSPDNHAQEARQLATKIDQQNFNVLCLPRIDVLTETPVSISVQFTNPDNNNKLISTGATLALHQARKILELTCLQYNKQSSIPGISLQIHPFNGNPVQYVNMLRGIISHSKIPENNIECCFNETLLTRSSYRNLYNAISELKVKMHIVKFSFSLHSLSLIQNSRCDAIELDLPLTHKTHLDTTLIETMLAIYRDKNIRIIGSGITSPDEYELAIKINCSEVLGPAITDDKF